MDGEEGVKELKPRPPWFLSGRFLPRKHLNTSHSSVFLVVLCQQNARDYIQYSTSYAICVPCGCHMTADTAQPRKRSNVTRPLSHLWVGSGDETSVARASLVPRPSRAPARKRVWNLSQDFLALLSQHVRKTGKPIRTQDSKKSCDFNAYWNTARFQFQLPSVYARIGIGPYAQST